MCGWAQEDMFLAGQGGQESRNWFDFCFRIRGIYLSLAFGTGKFKQLD